MTMRVLQVVTDNDRRGAQIFATDLESALTELGLLVQTVALAPGRVGGLEIPSLGDRRRSPRTIWALRRKARQVDVLVAHGSTSLPVVALATLGLSRPFVYRQISDSLFWAPTTTRRMRVRTALSRASGVVALWDGAAQTLFKTFGVPRDRLFIIPNGVRTSSWRPPSADARGRARMRLALPLDRPVVTFVGALTHEKGPDVAVETIAIIPGAHLLVVGAGPQEKEIRSLAARLLNGRATFLGSTPSMWDAYAVSDLLLFPSRGGDSMPATVIEAGLMQVPTVATNTGALESMLEPGITGEVIKTPDRELLAAAVRSLMSEPTRRESIGRRARMEFLKRFDLGVVAQQWSGVLDKVIGTASRASESTGWFAHR